MRRSEALVLGLKRYATGKACRRGHVAERTTASHHCIECRREGQRIYNRKPAYRAKNRARKANEKYRAKQREYLRAFNGLPSPTRPCPTVCECCGRPPGKQALCLDHCHETGAFRGWLCARCNGGIGSLGDTIGGLQQAIRYLECCPQRFISDTAGTSTSTKISGTRSVESMKARRRSTQPSKNGPQTDQPLTGN